MKRKPASGIPAGGASKHIPGVCECVRCKGFQKGNPVAWREGRAPIHGAKSRKHVLAKSERVLELAEQIRSVAPVYEACDAYTVSNLAILLVRIERAEAALAQFEAEADERGQGPQASYADVEPWVDNLRRDLAKWLAGADRYLSALGMSPGSRARLGLDIARTRSLTVVEWHQRALEEDAS